MTQSPPPMRELPYFHDTSRLFEPLAGRPWAVFLDSGAERMKQGRYDLIACDPMLTLVTRNGRTEISAADGAVTLSREDPLRLLQSLLRQYRIDSRDALPFSGGALGYFSYDLGRSLERLPVIAQDQDRLPEMAIGLYDWALVVDHQERRSRLVGCGFDPRTAARWSHLSERFTTQPAATQRVPFRVTGAVESNMTRQRYADAFHRVQRYIRAGDCYQVNLAQRFSVTTRGDPWLAYRQLRQLNPAPFSAYLNTPAAQLLCSSPERFLRVREGAVETRPIKGTVARGANPSDDRELRQGLRRSSKDRAENLMIVDLLRNDLSKNSALGSVEVRELFALESYATVHHLVSTINSRLAEGRDALDLLRGCFPGGSITGAPKRRAMEIIEQLEPDRRGAYCGSIGYIGFDGNMDSNIAIRTMVHIDGRMRFWAGGGLVADSVLDTEYQETFHKAKAMLQLLQAEYSPPGSASGGAVPDLKTG
jgi:para-aminobenzoate synthetase component 1